MPILDDIMDHDVLGPAIREGMQKGRQEGRQGNYSEEAVGQTATEVGLASPMASRPAAAKVPKRRCAPSGGSCRRMRHTPFSGRR